MRWTTADRGRATVWADGSRSFLLSAQGTRSADGTLALNAAEWLRRPHCSMVLLHAERYPHAHQAESPLIPVSQLAVQFFASFGTDSLSARRVGASAVHVAALIGVVLVSALPGLARASDWEMIAEREGIVVSRRPVEGRGLPQLRSVGEVLGTPYEVLAILLDVPAHVDWRPDCVESKTVRRVDTWRSIIYTRTDAPWPVSDREVVVENEVIFIDPPSKVKVTFRAVTAPDVERTRGTVRMKMATGFYAIEAIDDARALVHYEVDADPGGSLPDWLVSMQSTRNPFETLAGLRSRLEETRGQYRAQIARFPP